VAGLAALRGYGVPLVRGLAAASPGLALGHAIGRVGCFLVGDDYGRPSTLPWAVAFPKGLPPTDVWCIPRSYAAVPLALLAWLLLRWRREARPTQLCCHATCAAAPSVWSSSSDQRARARA
jgi:phosphatidylglycerol:prolipoprotein diacylglycerol transferase